MLDPIIGNYVGSVVNGVVSAGMADVVPVRDLVVGVTIFERASSAGPADDCVVGNWPVCRSQSR